MLRHHAPRSGILTDGRGPQMINLWIDKEPAPRRIDHCLDDMERHLKEPAVQLAVANWLLEEGASHVSIHPDGLHMPQFPMEDWLGDIGFSRIESRGSKGRGGLFRRGDQTVEVFVKSGKGDVVATLKGARIFVEAKGGIVNTRNPGQKSRLRKGLSEAVGQLMSADDNADRLIAAVPYTEETRRLALKMIGRASKLGIEIALVHQDGKIDFVSAPG